MIRLLCLLATVGSCLTFAQLSPLPVDTIQQAEVQRRMLLDRSKQYERDMKAMKSLQQKEFALKFNQLVDALYGFAVQFNEGKGSVWPQREAAKLRKAMHQLEEVEKSFRKDE